MSTRFRTNAAGQAAYRRNGKVLVLVLSLLVVALLLYNYAASAASIVVPISNNQQRSRASLSALLVTSTAADGGSGGPLGGVGSSGSNSRSRAAGSSAAHPLKEILQRPIAKPDPAVVKQRCGAALGDWCGRYEAQTPVPALPPPIGTKECLWGCNFVGEPGPACNLSVWQPWHMRGKLAGASGGLQCCRLAGRKRAPSALVVLQGCAMPPKAGVGAQPAGRGTTAPRARRWVLHAAPPSSPAQLHADHAATTLRRCSGLAARGCASVASSLTTSRSTWRRGRAPRWPAPTCATRTLVSLGGWGVGVGVGGLSHACACSF
jgi:hypothetical protein